MSDSADDKARALARQLSKRLDDEAASEVLDWMTELKAIRDSDQSVVEKAKRVVALSLDSRTLRIVLDVVGDLVVEGTAIAKKAVWDDRGWPARIGLTGVVAAIAAGGSQGAGIAALGGAVGVPLWLVFGAGGSLLGTLIDELTARNSDRPAIVRYVVSPRLTSAQFDAAWLASGDYLDFSSDGLVEGVWGNRACSGEVEDGRVITWKPIDGVRQDPSTTDFRPGCDVVTIRYNDVATRWERARS